MPRKSQNPPHEGTLKIKTHKSLHTRDGVYHLLIVSCRPVVRFHELIDVLPTKVGNTRRQQRRSGVRRRAHHRRRIRRRSRSRREAHLRIRQLQSRGRIWRLEKNRGGDRFTRPVIPHCESAKSGASWVPLPYACPCGPRPKTRDAHG